MNKIKSDIEIARASKMKPIGDVLRKFNIPVKRKIKSLLNHAKEYPLG